MGSTTSSGPLTCSFGLDKIFRQDSVPTMPLSSLSRRSCRLSVTLLLLLPAILSAAPDSPPQGIADADTAVSLKKLSLEELSQIEVTTPSKEPAPAFGSPVAISVITGDDIRRSGATSIPEALRLAPGVDVERIDSNRWSIGIRGFGTRLTRSVLVLIDGREVYTTLFAGTYWEAQDTDMVDIDRIEVIRGPGGVIWGPNAVDGVINIITKSSKDSQGLLVMARGGNVNLGNVAVRYGGGNGRDFTYRVYAKAFADAHEYHSNSNNYDAWRSAQTGFRMEWSEGARGTFTLQGDGYVAKAGEGAGAVSYTPPYSQNLYGYEYLSGVNILGRWQRTFSPGNDVQIQAYVDHTNHRELNLADYRTTSDLDYLQRVKLDSRQQLSFGLGSRVIPIYDPIVVSGLTFTPIHRTDQLYTAFFQDEIALVPERLSLTIGTKLLHTNFTEFEPEPSARLAWMLTRNQTVWAAFTHAIRTPSDAEENFTLSGYIGPVTANLQAFAAFLPNPNFAPEQLNSYELGYRRLFGKSVLVDFAGFLNHYHDLFDEELIADTFSPSDTPPPLHLLLPAQFRNGLLGHTTGFEIAPEWRPAKFWRLRGSYSYLDLVLKNSATSGDIGTIRSIDGGSPKHQIMAQSAFDVGKKLQLDFSYRYISALWALGIPAYSTADARVAWLIRPNLELSLTGQNLLQSDHLEYVADAGPNVAIKRAAYLQLIWTK
jgi:iron complex outermembrane receptor protein